jgi:hypothetical protein
MTEAEMIWKLVLALSVLLGMAVAVKKVFFSRLPQPFAVVESDSYMTRRECAHQFAMCEARILAVERRLDKDLSEMRVEIAELHEKINGVAKQNAEHHADIMRALGRLEGSYQR